MISARYELRDIKPACATLMDPARRILDEHHRNLAAREEQSMAAARIADGLEKTGRPGMTPEELRAIAYAPTQPMRQVLCEESALILPGRADSMNLSSIQSLIIQAAGRCCDRFASDVLVELAMLEPFGSGEMDSIPRKGEPNEWLIPVGLREDGCDGHDAVMHKLKESMRGTPYVYPAPYYRKLLAVHVSDIPEDGGYVRRTVALLDMTHDVYKLADGD